MYRSKDSLLPIQYYNRLPKNESCDVAFVVDPCIATSNTIHAVVSILKKWGAKKIVVVAAIGARAGVTRLLELHPDVNVYIGAIDEVLSESGMIVPGIGDAGDRQFGTPSQEVPTLLPADPVTSPKKRKAGEA
jgi:uracil phosphoribosyltransferase